MRPAPQLAIGGVDLLHAALGQLDELWRHGGDLVRVVLLRNAAVRGGHFLGRCAGRDAQYLVWAPSSRCSRAWWWCSPTPAVSARIPTGCLTRSWCRSALVAECAGA